MKISKRQLLQIIYEETQGYGKDVLSRSWGAEGEEADPKLDYAEQTKDEDDDMRDNRDVSEGSLRSLLEVTEDHEMYERDGKLYDLADHINNMIHHSTEASVLMDEMGMRYGELAALGTDAKALKKLVDAMDVKYASKLDDIVRFSK
jgi:uncharacterized protein (UPF0335 family)